MQRDSFLRRHPVLSASAIFIVVSLIFLHRPLSPGRAFFSEDVCHLHFGARAVISESLATKSLPVWNPYNHSGAPFLADPQMAVFYPLSFLFFIMEFPTAYAWTMVLHFSAGALAMFLFVRHGLKLSWLACVIGGLTYAFGSFFQAHSSHLNTIFTCPWLPLAMLFFVRWENEGGIIYPLLGCMPLGITLLAGAPQIAVYSFICVVVWLLIAAVQRLARREWRRAARSLLVTAMVCLLPLLLAAAQLLPTTILFRESVRSEGLPIAEMTRDSAPPLLTIAFLFIPAVLFNHEFIHFIGPLPLVLGAYAAVVLRRKLVVKFLAIVCIVSLFLMFGRHNVLYTPISRFIPLLNLFRCPGRFFYLFTFAIASLGALGAHRVLYSAARSHRTLAEKAAKAFALCAVIVCLGMTVRVALLPRTAESEATFLAVFDSGPPPLSSPLRPDIFTFPAPWPLWRIVPLGGSLFSLIVVWLLFHRMGVVKRSLKVGTIVAVILPLLVLSASTRIPFNWTVPTKIAQTESDTIRFLKQNLGDHRMFALERDPWYMPNNLEHNLNAGHQIRSASGYLAGICPVRRYFELCESMISVPLHESPLFRLASVKYLLTPQPIALPNYKLVHTDDYLIYENMAVLPTVFFVDQVKHIGNPREVLVAVTRADFDPATVAFVEEPIEMPISMNRDTSGRGSAVVVQRGIGHIVARTARDRAGLLVLSEGYCPLWRASIDGFPTKVYRTDYQFMSIIVPAGNHKIVLHYSRSIALLGISLSAVTWIGTLGAVMFLRQRCKQREEATQQH